MAQELVLRFVPDPEQRPWRVVTRHKCQLIRHKVRLTNQLESLLERAHIKLLGFVSNLPGVSARCMLKALAEGESDPAVLAALADHRLRATPEHSGTHWARTRPDRETGSEGCRPTQAPSRRVGTSGGRPGFGVDPALEMIAEVGSEAAAFNRRRSCPRARG